MFSKETINFVFPRISMFHRDSKGHVAALVGFHMTKIMILMMMMIILKTTETMHLDLKQ